MSLSHDVVHVLHYNNGEIFGVAASAEEATRTVETSCMTALTHAALPPDGTVYGFAHRIQAGAHSLDFFSVRSDTYQHYPTISEPVPIRADCLAWRLRERSKDRLGIPWVNKNWWRESIGELHHYVYPSQEAPGMLCYTPDDEYGNADRQIRTKPGRYLRRFFGDVLSDREIAEWAAAWSAVYSPPTLQFAHTPEEIERVYVNGPRSCMSHPPSEFGLDVHPASVYGAGDLAVVYITDGLDPDHITARALVWPAKKIRSSIYGDYQRLRTLLDDAGYTIDDLAGARLLRVTDSDGRLIAPYVDGDANEVVDHGTHLTLEYEGDYLARATNGLVQPRYTCQVCDEGLNEDDIWTNDDGDAYCAYCYSENYRHCTQCNEETRISDCIANRNGDHYCEYCYHEQHTCCSTCYEELYVDEAIAHDGEHYCSYCFSDKYVDCERCAATIEIDSNNTTLNDNNEFVCLSCAQVPANEELTLAERN